MNFERMFYVSLMLKFMFDEKCVDINITYVSSIEKLSIVVYIRCSCQFGSNFGDLFSLHWSIIKERTTEPFGIWTRKIPWTICNKKFFFHFVPWAHDMIHRHSRKNKSKNYVELFISITLSFKHTVFRRIVPVIWKKTNKHKICLFFERHLIVSSDIVVNNFVRFCSIQCTYIPVHFLFMPHRITTNDGKSLKSLSYLLRSESKRMSEWHKRNKCNKKKKRKQIWISFNAIISSISDTFLNHFQTHCAMMNFELTVYL